MRAKKLPELKNVYNFEAPLLTATIRGGCHISAKNIPSLDLNALLAPNSDDVYMVQVSGESMIDEGISDGDILIVNKCNIPRDGSVIIASLNGSLLVKTYREISGKVYLISANNNFLPIEVFPDWALEIQGVVKYVIHNLVK